MGSEHTLYVSSSACRDIYINNSVNRFINRLSNPITLNPHIEYEVGLVSILYPSQYYVIANNDKCLSINTYINTSGGKTEMNTYIYRCNKNIVGGYIKDIIEILDEDLMHELRVYYDSDYGKYIKKNTVICWDERERRVGLKYVRETSIKSGAVSKITINMSKSLGRILGFRGDVDYEIYGLRKKSNILAVNIPIPSGGLDYIYVYCDIIHPSPFGNQLVNILDCFTFHNGSNKGIHNTIYKSIKNKFIDEIAIIITDQNGNGIHFCEGTSITCVLHIRPQ